VGARTDEMLTQPLRDQGRVETSGICRLAGARPSLPKTLSLKRPPSVTCEMSRSEIIQLASDDILRNRRTGAILY
jgi:hypothetical protein